MSLAAHPITQRSLDISSIWTPIAEEEVRTLHLCPVWITRECWHCTRVPSMYSTMYCTRNIVNIKYSRVQWIPVNRVTG
jgi:hypothetical protein